LHLDTSDPNLWATVEQGYLKAAFKEGLGESNGSSYFTLSVSPWLNFPDCTVIFTLLH